MANYGDNNDLVDIKIDVAKITEQISNIREDIHVINAKLDRLAEQEVTSRIRITALLIIGFVSGGAGSLLLKMVSL